MILDNLRPHLEYKSQCNQEHKSRDEHSIQKPCQAVSQLVKALDIFEPEKGFRVLNDHWGAPAGSQLVLAGSLDV